MGAKEKVFWLALTRIDETDLLTVLHAGWEEQPRWATFLDRLRRRAGAGRACILLGRIDMPGGGIGYGGRRDGPTQDASPVLLSLYRRDPGLFHRMRPGRTYEADILDPRAVHGEITPPPYRRLIRVVGSRGINAWLGIANETRDFDAADGALLAGLAIHLAIATDNLGRAARPAHGDAAIPDCFARAGFGWVSLDPKGGVIDGSEKGIRLARLRAPNWMLRDGHPTRRFVRTDGGEGAALLAPVDDPETRVLTGAVAIGYLAEPAAAGRLAAVLVEMFRLSAREAALAEALCAGASIAGAGRALGLTIETARNYSKRIYAKTGTRGQADLVRQILTSVALLA